ncbi:279_t:CDS:2 [Gigaspora margarita]|uniref:279_t:CDS:1 n=1 Tax=Gigaspora margarita TaxID=4874 RepID=A0ABN7VC47_GIGMA|nr:279_t:CDS:2 [Gigaspora margarita]
MKEALTLDKRIVILLSHAMSSLAILLFDDINQETYTKENRKCEAFKDMSQGVALQNEVVDEIKKSDLCTIICLENEFIDLFDVVEEKTTN